MDATRALVHAAVAALVVTALAAPADAAGTPTCRGLPATIVGEPGGTIAGTDGDDVIVTNGEADVDSGAGDDVVCVTDLRRYGAHVRVQAGTGADVVDTTDVTVKGTGVATILGPGRDRFHGGPQGDGVVAGTEYRDRETDHIVTGGGYDSVTTGEAGEVDADDVDLGKGMGSVRLESERATGELRAAPGSGADLYLWPRSPGAWVINDRTDRATLDGETISEWSNFRVAEVHGLPRARLHYVGTKRRDYANLYGRVAGAELGAGTDDLTLYELTGLSGSFVGGPGNDHVRFWGEDQLLVDLERGRLGTDITSPSARISGFENLEAMFIGEARLVGTGGPNLIRLASCNASVAAGGGDDRIVIRGNSPRCDQIPQDDRDISEYGGAGNDLLRGSAYSDHLIGGPGQDRAIGRQGFDVCRAEREVECDA